MKINLMLKGRIIQVFGSQVDFSEALGIDESLVSRYVNNRRPLPAEQAKEWAILLKIKKAEYKEFFTLDYDGPDSVNIDYEDLL